VENPDEQAFAEHNPRAILDEVQRCPHLSSWLQGLVDERGRMGGFVLTGSAQFDLIAGITQSLAGRVGRIALLPLTADELAAAGKLPSTPQASCLVARSPAYHRNFGKRLVKSPKLYFLDVGLMAWLLGIRDAAGIQTHAARGALFETWVVSECIKQRFNAGQGADLFFWRKRGA
jgi:predicted AAA+ superfamily ATPase